MQRRLRFPMIAKFFVGCFVLAGLLVSAGAYLLHQESKMKSRGDYLKKHFERYLAYQEGVGASVSTVADLLAHDDELRRALSGPVAMPAPPDGQPAVAPEGRDSSAMAESMFKRLSGKNSVRPDLFVVVDRSGRLVFRNKKSIITADDFRTDDSSGGAIGPVTAVLTGADFFNQVFIHNGAAVQLAGVPIRASGGEEVVGGLLIGVDVSRYMSAYKEQSDDKEVMKHRLVMITNDKDHQVVASVFPKDEWKELGEDLKTENWVYQREGDFDQRTITLGKDEFDLFPSTVRGFVGSQWGGEAAKMFLLRSRSNLKGRKARKPVKESLIGVALALIIAFLLSLWITRPIKRFVKQSKAILEGGADLSQRIEIRARDETADLAENINQVFARLHILASEVQTAAFQVGASSAEISAASKQMLEGLTDQTLKIESSTAAVTELSASIQQVASNAVEATKVAEKSNVAVTNAVGRMQQIRGAVEDAGDKMQDLGESSKRIGNIVEVIRQISEQTSLLALNASIEAAHAGEQGRGFAVVADEVSSLARRVGQSAKDIEALIQTIKEQTTAAVHSMEVGTSEVEQGTELVTNTLNDLGQLIAVVNDTAAAVQEQAMVSDEIARNMDAVQKIASEMVAGSEEAVQQGEQLHTLAFGLEQSVGGFNLDHGRTPQASGGGGNRPQLRDKSAS